MRTHSHPATSGGLAFVVFCALCHAATVENPAERLTALQALYDKHLAALETDYTTKLATWPQSYTQQLVRLQKKLQQAGDLERWARVQNEMDRFTASRSISPTNSANSFDDLTTLQSTFVEALRDYELDRNRRLVELAKQYTARVEEYQKLLTMQGDMDAALTYNAEIKRIRTSPEITAAEFDLAELELKVSPPEVDTDPVEVDPNTQGLPLPTVQTLTPEGVVVPGAIVYAGSGPAMAERPRRVILKPTDRAKTIRKLTTKASLHQSTSSYDGGDSNARYKYEKSHNTLHVSLRAVSSDVSIATPYVVIQVFSKDISKKGAVDVREERIARTRLAELGTDWVTIATPSIGITRYTKDERYSAGTAKGGREFYGAIVSVFDGQGELAYQGFEGNSLEKLAPSEVPKQTQPEIARCRLDTARLHYLMAERNLKAQPGDKECAAALKHAKDRLEQAELDWETYQENRS